MAMTLEFYDLAEELMEQPVLPLFMETFVENAVKHQWRPDRQLYIQVRAAVLRNMLIQVFRNSEEEERK